MEKSFPQRLKEEFDLPTPVAVWVVITHIFVLASPLALIWAIHAYGHWLPLANPILVQFASAVYIAATAFETAQNSADRWFLTEATRSVADLFFNSLITVAACMYTMGFYGNGCTVGRRSRLVLVSWLTHGRSSTRPVVNRQAGRCLPA